MSKGLHKSILFFLITISILFTPQITFADEQTQEYIIEKVPQNQLRSLSIQSVSNSKYDVINSTRAILEGKKKKGEIKHFQPNRIIKPTLATSVPLINATAVWKITHSGINNTGIGQTICIIDTGIKDDHPDLSGRQLAEYDFYNSQASVTDQDGHGTHVAGIALANGSIRGVAPGANYVDAKILQGGFGYTSDLIDAIEYCTDNSATYNITVISMSLGSTDLFSATCDADEPLLTNAVNAAVAKNITVIAASGNDYSDTQISSPACISSVIAIGASTNADTLAGYANLNSLVDIVAPGSGINSTDITNSYDQLSGTSMATPHVAGVLALLLQYTQETNKPVTPTSLFTTLTETGVPIYYAAVGKNFSRVDVYAAIQSLNTFNSSYEIQTPDSILTPAETLINISVTLPNKSEYFVDYANVTLSLKSLGNACNNENFLNLSYNGTTWNGNCTLNTSFLPESPQAYNFTIQYVDVDLNTANVTNISYILHNITTPTYTKSCFELNTTSTDISLIENYERTNLSLQFMINQSCYTQQNKSLTNWNNFTNILTLNYTNSNLSSLQTLQSIARLNETLNFTVTTRYSYHNTSFDLASSLTAFAQNATVYFQNLGFNTKPQGVGEVDYTFTNTISENTSVASISRLNVNISTLVFSDTISPTLTINSPIQLITTNQTHINFTINTTITNLAQIEATFQNQLYQYNTTAFNDSFSCTLNQTETDLHNCIIYNVTTTDSANAQFQMNITDFGNNTLEYNTTYLIDTSAPNITFNVSNGTTFTNDIVSVQWNISDLHNVTCWTNSNGTNTTETTCTTTQNVTFSNFSDGNHTITFYANDSNGFRKTAKLNVTILEYPTIVDKTLQTQKNGSITFSLIATDNDQIQNASLRFNNTNYDMTNTTNNRFTFTLPNISAGIFNYSFSLNDTFNHTTVLIQNITIITLQTNQTILENDSHTILITNTTNTTELLLPKNKNATNITIQKNSTGADAFVFLNLSYLNTTQNITLPAKINITVVDELNTTIVFATDTLLTFELNQTTLLQTPTIEQKTNFALSKTTIREVISVGSNGTINASKPIHLMLHGEGGRKAAFAQSQGTLTKIATVCDNATNPTNIDSNTTRECYITNGDDLVIWTYHLTYFASYTDVVSSGSSGGGGGSSSGGSSGVSQIVSTESNTTRLTATYVVANINKSFTVFPTTFSITNFTLQTNETTTNVVLILTKEEPIKNTIYETYTLSYTNLDENKTTVSLIIDINESWAQKYDSIQVQTQSGFYNMTNEGKLYRVEFPLQSSFSIIGIPKTEQKTPVIQVISQIQNKTDINRTTNETIGETSVNNSLQTLSLKQIISFAVLPAILIGLYLLRKGKKKPKAVFKIPKF